MNKLAPSILSADFSRLGDEIALIENGGAHFIHADVMDGHFVPNITMGPMILKSLAEKTEMPFDIHLMIENPERYIESFVMKNTEFITVHAEACTHLHRVIQQIKACGVKAGVSFNPATPLDVLEYILDDVDLVLIMSVNPGFGGQKFIPSAIDKIKTVYELKNTKRPDLQIEVDGGITTDNIQEVLQAGANIIVAGSAIFCAEDVSKETARFIDLMK